MIEFSKGGYKGDGIEELFKWFTAQQIPYWWHFREVLRANHLPNEHWVYKNTGKPLSSDDAADLVAISLMMYHIYTCLSEAIAFSEQLGYELNKTSSSLTRWFEVKKNWKAAYSSLYSSYSAVCNLMVVVICQEPILKNGRNYTNRKAKSLLSKYGDLKKILEKCEQHLTIRHHLDHFWLIWIKLSQGKFIIDEDFSKGYVRTSLPPSNYNRWEDGEVRLEGDIYSISKNFNFLFFELSREGGYLDNYLASKSWQIKYSDYGPPHNGQRPKP